VRVRDRAAANEREIRRARTTLPAQPHTPSDPTSAAVGRRGAGTPRDHRPCARARRGCAPPPTPTCSPAAQQRPDRQRRVHRRCRVAHATPYHPRRAHGPACRASAKRPVGAGGVDTGPPHAGAPTLPPCREAAAGRDGVSAVAARPRTRPPDTSRRPHCPVHAPMKNGRHGQWAANATHAPTVVRQGMDGVARDVTPRRSRTRSVSAARRAPLRPRSATDTRAATSPEGRSGAAGSAVADLRAPLREPTCSRSAMCATR